MKKFTIVFNKVKHELQADTLPNFKNAVFEIINVPPETLKIIKPSIKVALGVSAERSTVLNFDIRHGNYCIGHSCREDQEDNQY